MSYFFKISATNEWLYKSSVSNDWSYQVTELEIEETPDTPSGGALITKLGGLFITTKDGRQIVTAGTELEVPEVIVTKDGRYIITKDGRQIKIL